ncbi:hypothetical protein B0H14DRAFT_3770207 [Mycena olivaceomarginata]|nr:hypothetical protein B0H14DRAFT_3770207 [Mycena olivaceomarginata]
MAPRSLPPLEPPPAHCLPPVPAFTEPICRNCIGNWKLVVKLQAECKRLSRDVVKQQEQRFDLGFNMVARLFHEFEDLYESYFKASGTKPQVDPSAPNMKHTDHTSERSGDESDPRITSRIEQTVASQDEAFYHEFEDLAESCTKAPDEVDPSARGVPDMGHTGHTSERPEDKSDPRTTKRIDQAVSDAPKGESRTEQIQLHSQDTQGTMSGVYSPLTVDSFNNPITNLRSLRAYALCGSRTNDFPCGILVGHRRGIDIPVSILWKDAPGEVLFQDDGSAFRLHLTAGPTNAITGAIFKCSKDSHEDLVNMRPEHQTAAMSFAKSRL